MANWEDDIVAALNNLGGSASYKSLYAEIERIRPELPPTWKEVVRRYIQNLSSDSDGFKNGKDLFFSVEGKGSGTWGLRTHVKDTPEAVDLSAGHDQPSHFMARTYRVLRDTTLARQVKLLHRDRCQICGQTVRLANGATYAEAHHIRPIGSPHNGPDTAGNILVLCPNDHVLCDYGARRLNLSDLRSVTGHHVSQEFIDYHNTVIVVL